MYLRDVVGLNLDENGLYNTLPLVVQFVTSLTISILADKAKERWHFSSTVTCKVIQTFGEF